MTLTWQISTMTLRWYNRLSGHGPWDVSLQFLPILQSGNLMVEKLLNMFDFYFSRGRPANGSALNITSRVKDTQVQVPRKKAHIYVGVAMHVYVWNVITWLSFSSDADLFKLDVSTSLAGHSRVHRNCWQQWRFTCADMGIILKKARIWLNTQYSSKDYKNEHVNTSVRIRVKRIY